jgi:hypothetical protein
LIAVLFNYTLDKQLEKRPKEVKFCKRCTVSNQRPRITFDEHGVCSACNYAFEKHNIIDWDERERELKDLLDRHRSKDGSYDVIVPGSGGKDSAYVSHQLKYVYDMHPLCVTFAPFEYTEIGWRNFINWTEHFDVYNVFANREVHRKLSRLSFELLGDAWQPFIYPQKALAMQMALKFKIPLVFYGESGELE